MAPTTWRQHLSTRKSRLTSFKQLPSHLPGTRPDRLLRFKSTEFRVENDADGNQNPMGVNRGPS